MTSEELVNLFLLKIKFKMKDLKMKESFQFKELKFIKWNNDIIEILEVFHI